MSAEEKKIGPRPTWSQHFKNNGYYTARVSKIYHMAVPAGIVKGSDGADDPASWTEKFNSQGPEYQQIVKQFKAQLKEKLEEARDNDIERALTPKLRR